MRQLWTAMAVVVLMGASEVLASTPDCGKDTEVVERDGSGNLEEKSKQKNVCKATLDQLHPTQFAVGMDAVQCKMQKLEDKDASDKLKDSLKEEDSWVPLVRGPGGLFYLTDHHHLSVALYNAKLKNTKKALWAYLVADFSDAPTYQAFWDKMVRNNYAWLEDNTGTAQPASHLPTQLWDMSDDPMRTLSAWVRNSCGYVKCDAQDKSGNWYSEDCSKDYPSVTCAPPSTYFLEFKWADFLRKDPAVQADMGKDPQCNEQDPLDDTCLSGQYGKLNQALPPSMTAVASQAAATALGSGVGYNPNAHAGTPPPASCSKDGDKD